MVKMEIEEWKDVVSFEGIYQVSSYGNVKSLNRTIKCKNGYRNYRGKLIKAVVGSSGYSLLRLHNSSYSITVTIHSLVMKAFVSEKPNGMECRHLDGNKTNNKLTNLKWGTPLENYNDSIMHGTAAVGDRNGLAKISNEDINIIRLKYASGVTQVKLAKEYGVSQPNISYIVNSITRK